MTEMELSARLLNRALSALSRLRWQFEAPGGPVSAPFDPRALAESLAARAWSESARGYRLETLDRLLGALSPGQSALQRGFQDFYCWLFEAFQADREVTLLLLAFRDNVGTDGPIDSDAILADSGLAIDRARSAVGRLRRHVLGSPEGAEAGIGGGCGAGDGWEAFFASLEDPGELAPWRDALGLTSELMALGLDPSRVASGAPAALPAPAPGHGHEPRGPRGANSSTWLDEARGRLEAADRAFERRARASQGFIDAHVLLRAIRSGRFGEEVRARAGELFGQAPASELAENDVRSFLDDCELLGLLVAPTRVKPIGES